MDYDAVVFSGGGCRCFWQAGFWEEAGAVLQPKAIAAVSAGSAFACAAIGGRSRAVLDEFKRRCAANEKNFYVSNLPKRVSPFPHHGMYRGTILETTDEGMLARLREGPQIRVLLAHPPEHWAPGPAAALGLASYRAEGWITRTVHPTWPRRLGFRSQVVTANDCSSPKELADLILQSSCLPPLVPILRRGGEPVIDGAVIDNVPVGLVAEARSTLVLLTRQYRKLPRRPGVEYLQPSEKIPVALWDYASPERIEATFQLGLRDGAAFARRARASA